MFRILHLTDLHAKESTQWSSIPILAEAKKLICEEAKDINVDAVAFTGDIAFSGKESEYKIAAEWLSDLCFDSSGLNISPSSLLIVPGNHDVDRSNRGPVASAIEDSLASAKSQDDISRFLQDKDSREILRKRFEHFEAFGRNITQNTTYSILPWARDFKVGKRRVRFEGLNSAWVCHSDDDKGNLAVGQWQFSALHAERRDDDLVVAMLHHPVGDLIETDEDNCVANFRNYYDLVLHGHRHRHDASTVVNQQGTYTNIAGGALHERCDSPNRFSIIDIPENFDCIRVSIYLWQNGQWIRDKNMFQDSSDGIGVIALPKSRSDSDATEREGLSLDEEDSVPIGDISERDESDYSHTGDDKVKDSAKKILRNIPRWRTQVTPQDLAIRQELAAEASLRLGRTRFVTIREEWGCKP